MNTAELLAWDAKGFYQKLAFSTQVPNPIVVVAPAPAAGAGNGATEPRWSGTLSTSNPSPSKRLTLRSNSVRDVTGETRLDSSPATRTPKRKPSSIDTLLISGSHRASLSCQPHPNTAQSFVATGGLLRDIRSRLRFTWPRRRRCTRRDAELRSRTPHREPRHSQPCSQGDRRLPGRGFLMFNLHQPRLPVRRAVLSYRRQPTELIVHAYSNVKRGSPIRALPRD
jgi:hypothetical protein